ncbi:MAG: PilN domain-containing protein, partial [Phycisphaerales bacterium]
SLIKFDLIQKEDKSRGPQDKVSKSKYQAAQAKAAAEPESLASAERAYSVRMDIEGIAPSDLQVAAYIEHLGSSILLEDVALIESKEKKVEDTAFRQFKLTAMLNREIHLTKEDIDEIRSKAEHTVYQF